MLVYNSFLGFHLKYNLIIDYKISKKTVRWNNIFIFNFIFSLMLKRNIVLFEFILLTFRWFPYSILPIFFPILICESVAILSFPILSVAIPLI